MKALNNKRVSEINGMDQMSRSLDWNKMEVLNNKMVCDWAMEWIGIHN